MPITEKANRKQLHCKARLYLIQDYINAHRRLNHHQPSQYRIELDALWSDLAQDGDGHLLQYEEDCGWSANEVVLAKNNGNNRAVTADYNWAAAVREARSRLARTGNVLEVN